MRLLLIFLAVMLTELVLALDMGFHSQSVCRKKPCYVYYSKQVEKALKTQISQSVKKQ